MPVQVLALDADVSGSPAVSSWIPWGDRAVGSLQISSDGNLQANVRIEASNHVRLSPPQFDTVDATDVTAGFQDANGGAPSSLVAPATLYVQAAPRLYAVGVRVVITPTSGAGHVKVAAGVLTGAERDDRDLARRQRGSIGGFGAE